MFRDAFVQQINIIGHISCICIISKSEMKLNQETASTSIYLEQIQNHIDLSEGYSKIRQLLFKQLHQADGSDPTVDDRLADTVAISLAKSLNSHVILHQSEKTFRTLQIITDLLTYAQSVMTPAMHSEFFVSALASVAMPKIVTFNVKLDMHNRENVLGIFAFWFEKYVRLEIHPYQFFLMGYRNLKDQKLTFPPVTIKPVDYREKQAKSHISQEIANANKIILEDIDEFTIKTEKALSDDIKAIVTTEYVRLIKHKSKILYDFTQKGSTLTEKEKSKVKDLYKRLRFVLKEIDKVNQIKISKNVSTTEQNYVSQKITPKKAEKMDSPIAKVEKVSSKKDEEQKDKANGGGFDLLEMGTTGPEVKRPSSKKVETPKKETPKKDEDKGGLNLLDFDFNEPSQPIYESPKRQRQVNFGDLLGSESYNSPKKQQLKQHEEDEQQFVDGQLISNPQLQQPQSAKKSSPSPQKVQEQSYITPKKSQQSQQSNHLIQSQNSSKSKGNLQFDNEDRKDKYAYIPHDLDLSPHSSHSGNDHEEKPLEQVSYKDKIAEGAQGLKLKLFGLFGTNQPNIPESEDLYDENKPYDDYRLQKVQSAHEPGSNPQPPQKFILQEPSGPLPIYKPVQAVDYSKYAVQRSPNSEEDEDVHIHSNKQFDQLEEAATPESPTKKEKQHGNLLEEDD